jgi:D-3-phosphoglycerate dehydrogenase / 2-oxoglutarate reductase
VSRPRILSTHRLQDFAQAMIAPHADLAVAPGLDDASLVAAAREADALIVRAPLPPALFSAAPRLRAAIRHGAGLDMVPMAEANAAGVLVANVPGANAGTVAEHVLMSALMLLRRHRRIDGVMRAGDWHAARNIAENSIELTGRTIGIVGFGAIGAALARMARLGFNMNVLAYRRSNAPLPDGITRAALEELLRHADIVVLSCPLTDETRGLIDAARLKLMRKPAVLINVSRGPVLVENDLIEALRSETIAGAALDVFATQPLPMDHPFRAMDQVVLTPHIAGITRDSMERIARSAVAQAIEVLGGGLPRHLVNPETVPAYRRRFPAG